MKKNLIFTDFIKPIIVLGSICIATSSLLAFTNSITAPIIEQSEIEAAVAQRSALLPAESFTQIDTDIEGVSSVYSADDGSGYVITAEANGYNGAVPVMIAIDMEMNIVGVSFLPNGETPGFGQKVRDEEFQNQFVGTQAQPMTLSDIEPIAGATVSSSAAVQALNRAIDAYASVANVSIAPSTDMMTPEEVHSAVLPDSGALTPIDTDGAEDITAAYKGEAYGAIVYAQSIGYEKEPLIAVVGFDDDAVITGVWFDATNETEGFGTQVGTNPDFAEGFVGDKDVADSDIIAQATYSSTAAIEAVNKALDFYKANVGGGAQ